MKLQSSITISLLVHEKCRAVSLTKMKATRAEITEADRLFTSMGLMHLEYLKDWADLFYGLLYVFDEEAAWCNYIDFAHKICMSKVNYALKLKSKTRL